MLSIQTQENCYIGLDMPHFYLSDCQKVVPPFWEDATLIFGIAEYQMSYEEQTFLPNNH